MTTADERAREYAAIQDDCEQLALANAGLLVEVAELTATVEAVKTLVADMEADISSALARFRDGRDPCDLQVSVTLGVVVARLNKVEGL